MRHTQTHSSMAGTCIALILAFAIPAGAYEVTLSLYNQGFDINAFYDNGNFDVDKGIIDNDPASLLVIVGDPANVEEVLEIPEILDPFELALLCSDFHFEVFQPFRFQDRFDGLFSTTVDDPVLLVSDNGVVTNFRDDGILADDRIDLTAYAPKLTPVYYEVNFGDSITMQTDAGINLYITRIWRNPDFTVTFDISDVPEPGTILLFGAGLFGIIGILRRNRMKQKTGVYKPAALLLLITMLMLAFPIRSDAFFWNDLKRGILLQYAYVENVAKLGTCVKEDGPAGEFLKCQNGSVEWNNGKAIAVYNPFYAKWASMNWGWSPLGEPVHEVVGTWGSPQGTGGQVQFFEGGDLYLHGNGTYAGQVFEAHGLIYDKYTEVGGTGSCLGFPISDQYTASNGWLRNDFEGGYIASEDGNLYEAYCTDGSGQSSRLKPQLTSVTASCVVSGRELTKQTDNFDLTWKPFTPSDFELTFDPYKLTTSAQTEIFPAVGVIANGGDFGGVLSDLMVVNEGYKVGFSAKYGSDGLSVTGGEGDISYTVEYDTEKKGFIVTATKGSVSVQIGPKFSTSDTSITLGDVEITSLAKFIKLIKFLEATKKMDDIFKEIEQKMNVFKNLPMSGSQGGCTYTIMGVTQSYPPKETQFTDSNDAFNFATFAKPKRKPIMSYSVGYDYSNLCCPSASPSIKDKNRFYGNVGANFGKLSCESPEIPVGYGFNVGATGSLSLGASVDLSGATTCESYKICVDPKITTDASLGIFVSFIHKSLARADLIGKVNADIAWKDVCYNPDSGFDLGSINVCAQPKVVGKITGLGFLTYEIEANVGGKICPYKRSF